MLLLVINAVLCINDLLFTITITINITITVTITITFTIIILIRIRSERDLSMVLRLDEMPGKVPPLGYWDPFGLSSGLLLYRFHHHRHYHRRYQVNQHPTEM